jgi:hypothetical protein
VSYHIELTNNSKHLTLETSDGHSVAPNGGTWKSGTLGDGWVASRELGTIAVHDIADSHIGGDSGETWGCLISYQGEEVVGRYEGGGVLKITVDEHGTAHLSGMNLRKVALPGLVIG